MQKIYILIPFIMLSLGLHAQVPNASFESWTNHGSYSTPDGWDNRNAQTASAATFTCQQGTPGTDGNYYMRLISKKIGSSVVNGIAVSGRLDSSTGAPVSGFPYTGRPASLTGKWQYMAFGNDQGYVSIGLTKWNTASNKRDTIGNTTYLLPDMVMGWADFSININYASQATPDSAMIVFSPSNELNATDNSYIFVDELKFSDFPTSIASANAIKQNIKAYPNPAKDHILLEFEPAGRKAIITLIDITGQVVTTTLITEGTNKYQLSIQNIHQGIYFLKMEDEKANATPIKLIIE